MTYLAYPHWWLIVYWALYYCVHSVLASTAAKSYAQSVWGDKFKYYRLFYSVVAILGFFAILFYGALIPTSYLISPVGWPRYFGLMLAASGVIIIKRSFSGYSIREFLGVKAEKEDSLVRSGILALVRHPLYSGTILVTIGFWLFSPSITNLITCLCLFAYLPIGIYFEEKKLILTFGESYEKYKREVPALIPRVRFW